MFTSRMLAPPRTCSSATSTASSKSPASTSERKRAEPVTFVRSPIITKPVSGPISNGSSPLHRVAGALAGTRRAGIASHGGGDLADVLGCGAAAAPDDVHEPVLRERAQVTARVGRLLVVLAHRVRQPRVRVARDVRVGHAGEALQERAHLRRAERAVDARDQRPCVLDRDPERLRGLAREIPTAPVDRREREPQRQVGRRPRARRRSPPSRSACRRSSRPGGGRRRPRRAPRSAPRMSARTSSNVTDAKRGVVDLRARRRGMTFSGPSAPATNRGRSGVRRVHSSAAARASRAPASDISAARPSSA